MKKFVPLIVRKITLDKIGHVICFDGCDMKIWGLQLLSFEFLHQILQVHSNSTAFQAILKSRLAIAFREQSPERLLIRVEQMMKSNDNADCVFFLLYLRSMVSSRIVLKNWVKE